MLFYSPNEFLIGASPKNKRWEVSVKLAGNVMTKLEAEQM